jgi:transposase InsO family protein
MDRHLEDDLMIDALQMALRRRGPPEGPTHHSDLGVQCPSNDYTDLLNQHRVRISMSRKGYPYDSAGC